MSELISFLTCDISGIARGRAFPRAELDRRLGTGVGWVPANLSLTPFGTIAPDDPHGSTGDLRLMADRETGVSLSWEDRPPLSFYLCDVRHVDGTDYECCPRTLLRETAARLRAETGLEASVSFEHEFELVSAQPPEPPFSLRAQRAVAPFGEAVVGALDAAGAEPEMFLPEYGPHQFEVTCRPTSPVAAADRAVVVREVVREVARDQGRRATFAPLSRPGGVGNGVHVHVGLAAADPGRAGLDPSEGAFAAGILRHAGALFALTAPSAVSYLRLEPHRWSVGAVALGHRNRETLLRVCAPAGESGHLEYRAADAAACPHLALACLLRAGLEGIRAGLDPPQPLDEDPSRLAPEALARRVSGEVPADLGAALEALRADGEAVRWMSPLLLETYTSVKRAELAAMEPLAPEERCERYTQVY